MNRILQLQQDKAAHLQAADAILKKAETEKRALTPEERGDISAKHKNAEEINETLTVLQRQAALTNIPNDRGNSYGARVLNDNTLDRPPFGPEPRSNESKEDRRMRCMIGMGEQLQMIARAGKGNNDARIKLREIERVEIERRGVPAGGSEQVPSDGGFLVYPDFSQEIMVIAHETGEVYKLGRKLPLSEATNAIKVPGIDEQSRVDGSRWGGVRMYWQNEADTLTGTKPKFRLIELVTKKLTGLYYATDELISDARLLGGIVSQAFGEEVGFKLDDAAINGDGAGKPQGVMSANCLITISAVPNQVTKTVVFQNVTSMWYRLHARSRKNAVWFVNQDVEAQLLQMSLPVGTGGSSVVAGVAPLGPQIYTPPGWMGNATGMLFGRPVIAIEQCQTVGTAGDIILADMSQWVYVDKGDVQQATSMHVRFLTDEMTFRWIYRVDGQPIWHTALTPFNGTNTQSPFIALASR